MRFCEPNCEKRQVGCHSKCKKYNDAVDTYHKKNENIKKLKEKEALINSDIKYRCNKMSKTRKRKTY